MDWGLLLTILGMIISGVVGLVGTYVMLRLKINNLENKLNTQIDTDSGHDDELVRMKKTQAKIFDDLTEVREKIAKVELQVSENYVTKQTYRDDRIT